MNLNYASLHKRFGGKNTQLLLRSKSVYIYLHVCIAILHVVMYLGIFAQEPYWLTALISYLSLKSSQSWVLVKDGLLDVSTLNNSDSDLDSPIGRVLPDSV